MCDFLPAWEMSLHFRRFGEREDVLVREFFFSAIAASSNKPISADSQKLRSFAAQLSAAGYGQRYMARRD